MNRTANFRSRLTQIAIVFASLAGLAGCGGSASESIDPNAATRDEAEARLDTAVPTLSITDPTSDTSYSTTVNTLNIAGTASDDRRVARVTWVDDRGGNGIATLSASNTRSVTWIASSVQLAAGANTLTVRVYDGAGKSSSQTLVVDSAIAAAPAPAPTPDPDPTTTTTTTSTSTSTSTTAPIAGVAWTGVTAAMWAEINTQRVTFGDANDCKARVDAVPSSGGVTLQPGADINSALASSNLVILKGGTYKLGATVNITAGKKLVGAPGEVVTLDAGSVDEAVLMTGNAVLANVRIVDAGNVGVNMGMGSNSALVYQVSVGRTGLDARVNSGGVGIGSFYDATNNCIVSTEVFDSYNEDGQGCAACADGGNADGYRASYGATNNTFIDSHAYRNSDDGFDFWAGNKSNVYFSSSFNNGLASGKTTGGDGNGFKLGIGSVQHDLYKDKAYNNKKDGFYMWEQTVTPLFVQCDATGNGGSAYSGWPQ